MTTSYMTNKKLLRITNIAISLILLVLLFLVACFSLNINSTKIIQYKKDGDFVYNYNGYEYYKISEENKERFSSDLYEKYQNYLPTDYEKVSNSEFEKCCVLGNAKSYIIPETVRVIYNDDSPIMIEEDNYITGNDYYLIVEN